MDTINLPWKPKWQNQLWMVAYYILSIFGYKVVYGFLAHPLLFANQNPFPRENEWTNRESLGNWKDNKPHLPFPILHLFLLFHFYFHIYFIIIFSCLVYIFVCLVFSFIYCITFNHFQITWLVVELQQFKSSNPF